MDKIEKILSLIIGAIVLLVAMIFYADNIIYKKELPNSAFCRETGRCPKTYVFGPNYIFELDLDKYGRYNSDKRNLKNPIVVFGGTFAYGYYELEKSFAYVLSKVKKRDVIDRSLLGGGLQSMYYQATQDDFYKIVPKAQDVVYLLGSDDLTTTLMPISYNVSEISFKLHYHVKKGKLVMSDYNSKVLNFFRSMYIIKLITRKYVEHYMFSEGNANKIADLETLYFVETKKALEAHWGNEVNFTVIINKDAPFRDLLTKKLEDNGFKVVNTEYLIKSNELDWSKEIPSIIK